MNPSVMASGEINVYKQSGKGYNYREISGKFGVVNTTGTDENLFKLVPVLGHGARVLPLELVPVLGYGAQTCAPAPTKGHAQTGALARPGTGNKSEQGPSAKPFI